MSRALAFLRRDLRLQLSYRFAFFLQFFNVFFGIFMFRFLSLLVGDSAAPYLADYGGDYFAFVLIGLAFSGSFGVGLRSFASNLRDAQITGTLEAMLMTPSRLSTIILSSGIYDYGFITFQVLVYLALGALIFNVQLKGNFAAALVILALTIVAGNGGSGFHLDSVEIGAYSAAVPEPSSVVLMSLGLVGLIGYRRHCRKKAEVS